jgi:Putative peptidoglycan binding domain
MYRTRTAVSAAMAACALLAMLAQAADAYRFGKRPLQRGDHGHDVRVLQRKLTELGQPTSADGRYGRRTRRSVKRYERAASIRVDGRVSRGQARRIKHQTKQAGTVVAEAPLGLTDGPEAVLGPDGRTALAPAAAPQEVKDAIAAANRITRKPYRYGGGHGSFEDSAYDCSGSVSYVLHGAGLLDRPRASGGLALWGSHGKGEWISVFANAGHAYMVIAGLRFDTSGRGEDGPRWRPDPRSGRYYTKRHPAGL